jgi:RNA polymerase sigma-B factor
VTRIDDKILLRRYHEDGDLQAREKLIEQYMSLVRSLARRYSYRGEQLEDLVQIGAIGLIKAIDRFDLERGVELTTYATPNIIGEIKRHFRDKGWSVRVPRGLQELNVQLSRLVEQLTVQPRTSASSRGVGERPSAWVSSPVAAPICIRSSWRRRGTRIAQPLSRK